MSEEAAGSIFVHASSAGVIVILFSGYAADFMVSRLRVQDYKAAYAGFRYHSITFSQFDVHAVSAAATSASVCMTMFMSMRAVHRSKQPEDIAFQRMVRTTCISYCRLHYLAVTDVGSDRSIKPCGRCLSKCHSDSSSYHVFVCI